MSEKKPYIPYNRSNKQYARENRKNQTPAEKIMREQVLRKKQTGYTFLRQKLIGSYILDFYCSKLMLAIEIDGDTHAGEDAHMYDARRTDYLNNQGIIVIRYTNEHIYNELPQVYIDLQSHISSREEHISMNHS